MIVVMAAFIWVVTGKHDILPTLLSGGHFTPVFIGMVSTELVFLRCAHWSLWICRPHSVLDIWLMVVLCAWVFDIALSALLNVARFDLGFYLGRIYGLFAASFVLAVLLVDNVGLQAQLSRLLGIVRQQAASEKIFGPNANGFSARSWNHPTMPSSPKRRRHHHRLERRCRTPVRLHVD